MPVIASLSSPIKKRRGYLYYLAPNGKDVVEKPMAWNKTRSKASSSAKSGKDRAMSGTKRKKKSTAGKRK